MSDTFLHLHKTSEIKIKHDIRVKTQHYLIQSYNAWQIKKSFIFKKVKIEEYLRVYEQLM